MIGFLGGISYGNCIVLIAQAGIATAAKMQRLRLALAVRVGEQHMMEMLHAHCIAKALAPAPPPPPPRRHKSGHGVVERARRWLQGFGGMLTGKEL